MSSEPLKKYDHAAASGEKRSKRKPKRKEVFSVYIYKVLKQVSKCFFSARNCFVYKLISACCMLKP